MEVFIKLEQEKVTINTFFFKLNGWKAFFSKELSGKNWKSIVIIIVKSTSFSPAAREGRRAARVAAEALQQAGVLQLVPQHADWLGEARPLLLL